MTWAVLLHPAQVMRREGPLAFFDGVGARCLWLTPRYVIAVSAYEYASRLCT